MSLTSIKVNNTSVTDWNINERQISAYNYKEQELASQGPILATILNQKNGGFTSVLSNNYDSRIVSQVLYSKITAFYIRGRAVWENGIKRNAAIRFYLIGRNTSSNYFWGSSNVYTSSTNYYQTYQIIPDNVFDDFPTYSTDGYVICCLLLNDPPTGEHTNVFHTIEYFRIYGESAYFDQLFVQNCCGADNIMQITDSKIYGYDFLTPRSDDYDFPTQQGNETKVLIVNNTAAEEDGYIDEIIVNIGGSNGDFFEFMIGFFDQRDIFLVRQSFYKKLTIGMNYHMNLIREHIPIFKGETLGIRPISASMTAQIRYKQYTTSEDKEYEFLYGEPNEKLSPLATETGGTVDFKYRIRSVDSPFAQKYELDTVSNTIEALESQVNSQKYIYDSDGHPYSMMVQNGQIVLNEVVTGYGNVLCLGNSLTSHGPGESSLGYYGSLEWAMASTNKVLTTWTYQLQRILRQKNSQAVCTPLNIYAWETNYMNCDFNTIFEGYTQNDYDLIIIRAGENGSAGSDYAQGVDRLVTYLRTTFQNANIVITDMFWTDATKEAGFRQIAQKYSYQYVQYGQIRDTCLLGQMLMGYDNAFHPVVHSGVAGHCTDVCFFDFANIMADALGYEQLTGKYTVVVNTSAQYNINNSYQIQNGYVTVLTYGNSEPSSMTVKDSAQNSINVQHINLSGTSWKNTPSPVPTYASVFLMPGSNVIVAF